MKMTCSETSKYLSRYQDGELDPMLRNRVEAHLVECIECREALENSAAIIERIKILPKVEAQPNFTALVMGQIEEKAASRSFSWFTLPSVVYSFVFALVFLLGLLLNPALHTPGSKSITIPQENAESEISGYSDVLAECHNLNLIQIQDQSLEMVYNENGAEND